MMRAFITISDRPMATSRRRCGSLASCRAQGLCDPVASEGEETYQYYYGRGDSEGVPHDDDAMPGALHGKDLRASLISAMATLLRDD